MSLCEGDSEPAKGYNGWKNYETWAVALWIDNEEGSYNRRCELAREAKEEAGEEDEDGRTAEGLLADQLKTWIREEEIPDLGASLYADLLGAALDEVDWYEIAENWLEEVE